MYVSQANVMMILPLQKDSLDGFRSEPIPMILTIKNKAHSMYEFKGGLSIFISLVHEILHA